jgi:hypothetical protein
MTVELASRLVCHWCGPGTQAQWYVPVHGPSGEETDRVGACDDHVVSVLACGYQPRELGCTGIR